MTEFTLKNIKYSDFASQETPCFKATLYMDGKRFCITGNDGQGGPDYYHPLDNLGWNKLQAQIDDINTELGQEILTTHVKNEDGSYWQTPNSLEFIVAHLMDEWFASRELKKILKRIAYVRPDHARGEVFRLPAHIKPTADNIEKVKQAPWWNADSILLNELSFADALVEFNADRSEK